MHYSGCGQLKTNLAKPPLLSPVARVSALAARWQLAVTLPLCNTSNWPWPVSSHWNCVNIWNKVLIQCYWRLFLCLSGNIDLNVFDNVWKKLKHWCSRTLCISAQMLHCHHPPVNMAEQMCHKNKKKGAKKRIMLPERLLSRSEGWVLVPLHNWSLGVASKLIETHRQPHIASIKQF